MRKMILHSGLTMILAFFVPTSSRAQLGDFLKKVVPPSDNSKKDQPSKTESLLRGGLKIVQGLAPMGYEEELAIGGAVALEAVARFGGLVDSPELEKYVATTGNAVARFSDRPEIPYYFGILNSEDPNAFACPGGYIFVTKGLVKMLRSEAELAGVLAHEIAHVSQKHALEVIQKSKLLAGASEVTLAAMDKNPAQFDAIVKEATNLIFEKGLSQDKEFEADAIGTDFAFRIGYNASGLRNFLWTLSKKKKGKEAKGIFKTHPSPKTRVSRLRTLLAKSQYRGYASFPKLEDRLKSQLAALSL